MGKKAVVVDCDLIQQRVEALVNPSEKGGNVEGIYMIPPERKMVFASLWQPKQLDMFPLKTPSPIFMLGLPLKSSNDITLDLHLIQRQLQTRRESYPLGP